LLNKKFKSNQKQLRIAPKESRAMNYGNDDSIKNIITVVFLLLLITDVNQKHASMAKTQAVWNSLAKTVLNSDSVAAFKSTLKHFSFPRLSLLPLLTNAAWPQHL